MRSWTTESRCPARRSDASARSRIWGSGPRMAPMNTNRRACIPFVLIRAIRGLSFTLGFRVFLRYLPSMLLGILSDTHDKADMIAAAVTLLQQQGAEFFIHCGDVGGEHILDSLTGLKAAFVWGNNDWD